MHLYHNPKIEARPSPLGGYGVFAKQDIAAGEQLEINHFIEMPPGYQVPEVIMKVAYGFPKGTGNLVVVLGYASLYNSALNKNAAIADWKTDEENRVFIHFAVNDIKAGEEILLFYNNYEFG